MTTVLVTGATGALGRAVIAHLRHDHSVRVVAISRTGTGTELFVDMRDPTQLAAAMTQTKPDIIFHLAALFAGEYHEMLAVNVEAARQMLELVAQHSPRTRVVLMGSAAEYGVIAPDENPIQENRPLAPVSLYGLTKAWQTQLAGYYAHRNVQVMVARVFNLDGPGLSDRLFIGRIQRQIAAVLAGEKTTIDIGPLSATRDYLSTDEAAAQIMAIALHGEAGGVYNVASGIPVTMREVLGRYLAAHGLNMDIVQEKIELTNRVGYDVPVIYADVLRITQLMNSRGAHAEA